MPHTLSISNSGLSLLGAPGRRLLRIAQALRAKTPAQARGYCFASSMEFCLAAQQENVHADVVIWSVRGDPDFLEHWAVVLCKDQVVDLTRLQVDGRGGVVFALHDYPSNFVRRRVYPAHLFSPAYEAQRAQLQGLERPTAPQMGVRQICHWRWLMLRHDCQSSGGGQLGRVLHAAASWLKAATIGSLHAAARVLRARKAQLRSRLHEAAQTRGAHAVQVVPHRAANDAAFQGASTAGAAYASKLPRILRRAQSAQRLSCTASANPARAPGRN